MSHLAAPAESVPGQAALFEGDRTDLGYVMNLTRLWGHLPEAKVDLFRLIGVTVAAAGLDLRERGILVTATAATLGDSYCSLAWGKKLAAVSDPGLAVGVLTGTDGGLTPKEQALANWARAVARDANATTPRDLDTLRAVGYDDGQIFAITTFIALRQAFATINDALGARPDAQLREEAPAEVVAAVGYGRPIAEHRST